MYNSLIVKYNKCSNYNPQCAHYTALYKISSSIGSWMDKWTDRHPYKWTKTSSLMKKMNELQYVSISPQNTE